MIPEIELLNTHFAGQKGNTVTQRAFMELLKEENFFNGEGAKDPAFSARDRINRAPKALGFVSLSPTINLTPAVARHLAKVKRETNKPAYCLFIAPNINDACIAHFYALHKMNISYYEGTSTIVPLPLSVFIKMVEDSHNAGYVPEPSHIQRFFERSNELANTTNNEIDWYNGIAQEALSWLTE